MLCLTCLMAVYWTHLDQMHFWIWMLNIPNCSFVTQNVKLFSLLFMSQWSAIFIYEYIYICMCINLFLYSDSEPSYAFRNRRWVRNKNCNSSWFCRDYNMILHVFITGWKLSSGDLCRKSQVFCTRVLLCVCFCLLFHPRISWRISCRQVVTGSD